MYILYIMCIYSYKELTIWFALMKITDESSSCLPCSSWFCYNREGIHSHDFICRDTTSASLHKAIAGPSTLDLQQTNSKFSRQKKRKFPIFWTPKNHGRHPARKPVEVALDIQSYLLRFGVLRYVFWGSKYRLRRWPWMSRVGSLSHYLRGFSIIPPCA